VVDRFLEHSRIFVFGAKGQVYLSSADWMPRNFVERIEVMFPIEDEALRARILDEILAIGLADNCKAWRLLPDGTYQRCRPGTDQQPLRSQWEFIELARSRGAHIFWCEQARDARPAELAEHLDLDADTYITFDIDALDPAIAPGTGTPEPGGFSYYEAKALLLAVCERTNVIGMDLVEVAPQYDGPAQLTALHGARLILDTVGAAFRRRG
jgi:hypothetical protein